jgi:uncharacterized protein YndB with AHSA1/START domain
MDVTHEVNSVERSVGSRILAAGTARTVTLSRIYDSPIEEVWEACTTRDRIQRWFMPISGDLRLGGRFQIEGNAGGRIERCDPPVSFSATWEMFGEVSWIELRLSRKGQKRTQMELEHIAHVDDERWMQFGPGAVGVGWDLAAWGLGRYLQSGQPVDPDETAAWSASEEGRMFIATSSASWGEASHRSGTDPASAKAAAERTTAFYTGADAASNG